VRIRRQHSITCQNFATTPEWSGAKGGLRGGNSGQNQAEQVQNGEYGSFRSITPTTEHTFTSLPMGLSQLHPLMLYYASRRAQNRFGSSWDLPLTNCRRLAHDFHLTQVWFFCRTNRPEDERDWQGEQVYKREFTRSYEVTAPQQAGHRALVHVDKDKVPDARILDEHREGLVGWLRDALPILRRQSRSGPVSGSSLPYPLWRRKKFVRASSLR